MSIQKTILIYDQCGEHELQFFILNGDYRKLNNVYINSSKCCEADTESLNDLMYDENTGELLHKSHKTWPYKTARAGAYVIVAGFLP